MTLTYTPKTTALLTRHRRPVQRVRLVQGVEVYELPVETSISLDSDNQRLIRRQASVATPFLEETWEWVREWATPEIWVDAGYEFPNGTTDVQRVFTGRVLDVASRRPSDELTLSCFDPSSLWEDQPVTADQAAVSTSTLATMAALTSGTGLNFTNDGVSDVALPSTFLVTAGTDRHTALDDLADVVHACLCADPDGTMRLHPQPTLEGSTAAVLEVGPMSSIAASSSEYQRSRFANRYTLIARWRDSAGNESSATGTATDTDPLSPTRWDGPAGRRQIIETLDGEPTNAATLTAQAKTRLQRFTGAGRGISITIPLTLWIDLHDRIWVRLPWGDSLDHVVIRISHDLAGMVTVLDTARPLSTSIT